MKVIAQGWARISHGNGAIGAVAAVVLLFSLGEPAPADAAEADSPTRIPIKSKASLVHLGSLDSFDITPQGTGAAGLLYEYLKNPSSILSERRLRKAIQVYDDIIPAENFGGEYTALQWLCRYFLASSADQKELLEDPVTAAFYRELAQDDFRPLKTYLKQKYHFDDYRFKKTPKSSTEFRFLEDFILFNNPDRDRWEASSKIIELVGLQRGETIADIGCGPGYYTFKFAELVGDEGHVYATDTNAGHIRYVVDLAKQLGVKNVEAREVPTTGAPFARRLDAVFLCSLYHNVYALASRGECDEFVGHIRKALKPDGRLILVDNALVEDENIPYHGPYIAKELIISQLRYYGFELVRTDQFIPQRYVLEFRLAPDGVPAPSEPAAETSEDCVVVNSTGALVRCPSAGGPGFTISGRKAARLFYRMLETKDPADAAQALAAYRGLIPRERFGDEYSAFAWFCEYFLADTERKQEMIEDPVVKDYFDRLAEDGFGTIKKYVRNKYYLQHKLGEAEGGARLIATRRGRVFYEGMEDLELEYSWDELNAWGDFIAFCNPDREKWEKTGKILEYLRLKPGDQIADLGCGAGYYTFKFARIVGDDGRVFAIDTWDEPLDYVTAVSKRHGFRNVTPVLGKEDDCQLDADSVDLVYVCSMYHAIYLFSMDYVQERFISSVQRALRPGGRLVVADNSILDDTERPYFGPGMAPELIIGQLKHYGFALADRAQFIPQRYVLVFQMKGER